MASASLLTCPVCAEDFSDERRCMQLSCRHQFCSNCIGRIERESNKFCPICRQPWIGNLVNPLEVHLSSPNKKLNDDDSMKKILKQEIICPNHRKPYEHWCHDCKVLVCGKCLPANHRQHFFDHIEDCVDVVGRTANGSLQGAVDNLSQKEADSNTNVKTLTLLTTAIDQFVERALELRSVVQNDLGKQGIFAKIREEFLPEIMSFKEKIKDMNNTNLVQLYSHSQDLVKRAENLLAVTSGQETSLIANVIMSYTAEVDKSPGEVDASSFVRNLGEREEVDLVLYKDAMEAEAKMEDDGDWRIDSVTTARAAVLATAHKKEPSTLRLVFTDDPPGMPVTAVSEVLAAVTDCSDVQLHCDDTFYNNVSDGIEKNKARLASYKEHNTSCELTKFYGQLDSAGLTELPDTVLSLGLSITDKKDAATVKAFKPWSGLEGLHVSVFSAMTAEQLSPLPHDVEGLYLYFPYLQDTEMDNIPQCIKSLVPKEHNNLGLVFDYCQLTFSAAERLPQLLTGIKIWVVTFTEVDEEWEQSQQDSLTEKFKAALGETIDVQYE